MGIRNLRALSGESIPSFARVANDRLNDLMDEGITYRSWQLATEHAEVVAQIGKCTAKPSDWDAE